MYIIPALDLYKGRVVRFVRGDPSASVTYSDSPQEAAIHWQKQGAEFLHIVDLSAALGEGDNEIIIEDIVKQSSLRIEAGGGIRTLDKAEKLVKLGVERLVIGTKGLDEDFLNSLISAVGREKIVVSVDVIHSHLAIEGWKKETDFPWLDFIAYLQLKGIQWIVYTDISRDGTLRGVNCEEIKKLAVFPEMNIIFAGGVSSLEDIEKLREEAPFLWGTIIGKALYDGKVGLAEAIALTGKSQDSY